MSHKTYALVSAIIFALVAFIHALRLYIGATVTFNGSSVPLIVSTIGLIGAGILAFWGFRIVARD